MRKDPLQKQTFSHAQRLKSSLLLLFCSSSRHGLKLWISPKHRAKNGSWQWLGGVSGGVGGLRSLFLKSTGLYGPPPPSVCWYLLKSSPFFFFLRQTGAHPRKLLRTATCSDTAFFPHYDLPLNSFTPADHHAAKRRSSHKTVEKKRKKENNRGKT